MSRSTATDQSQRAVAALCQTAFLEIRSSAYLRREIVQFGVGLGDGDYHEHIRVLADVCHNLPGGPPTEAEARRRLGDLWSTATDAQRAWIRATITGHSIDMDQLLVHDQST